MSKSLAIEYAKKNITTINCVSPGFIVSDMTDSIAEKVKTNLISRIPMAKLGQQMTYLIVWPFYHLIQHHMLLEKQFM